MKNRRNYYRLLQVQPDAPVEIIRSSFRTLMRELKQHPDLGGSSATAAMLNEAYEVLRDPERRAAYDRELLSRYPKRVVSGDAQVKHSPAGLSCHFCRQPLRKKAQPGDCCSVCRSPLESKQEPDLDAVHRRSIARMPRGGRIFYYRGWPGEAREAEMVDLSLKGLRFRCDERLSRGLVLKICAPVFEASAVITNVGNESIFGKSRYSIGVRFLAVNFEEPKGIFISTSA